MSQEGGYLPYLSKQQRDLLAEAERTHTILLEDRIPISWWADEAFRSEWNHLMHLGGPGYLQHLRLHTPMTKAEHAQALLLVAELFRPPDEEDQSKR